MSGWWSLGDRAVVSHVRDGWAGVYMLADTPGIPRYVGRSDVNLRSRLRQHAAAEEYRYFYVEHHRSADDAFHRESGLYHHYIHQLDNLVHPGVPRGCRGGCPRCSYGH